jgi:NAD(P)-dependent dehydrogenase (short-subunit alcohol dehydrogenase family)
MKTLRGKRVVITGAGGGIGKALSLALADEGCALAISDIDAESLCRTESLVRARGAKVFSSILDVSNKNSMRTYPDEVADALGGADIIVNNAGEIGRAHV